MRKFGILALMIIAAMVLAPLSLAPAKAQDQKNLAELAAGNPDLSILLAAVKAAGLDGVLAEGGPFTVFAPTNAAFEAALKALNLTAEQLLADKETLTSVLLYHVLPGTITSKAVAAVAASNPKVATLNMGQGITISTKDGKFFADNAEIVAVDVRASNGIVHVINSVILPKEKFMAPEAPKAEKDLLSTAAGAENLKTLVAAVTAVKPVAEMLSKAEGITVFAPTDEAFAAALKELNIEAAALLADTDTLTRILAYHVVPFPYPAAWVAKMDGVLVGTLVEDAVIQISVKDGKPMVNGAPVVAADIFTTNSNVVHVIGGVLLPPAAEEAKMEATPAK